MRERERESGNSYLKNLKSSGGGNRIARTSSPFVVMKPKMNIYILLCLLQVLKGSMTHRRACVARGNGQTDGKSEDKNMLLKHFNVLMPLLFK